MKVLSRLFTFSLCISLTFSPVFSAQVPLTPEEIGRGIGIGLIEALGNAGKNSSNEFFEQLSQQIRKHLPQLSKELSEALVRDTLHGGITGASKEIDFGFEEINKHLVKNVGPDSEFQKNLAKNTKGIAENVPGAFLDGLTPKLRNFLVKNGLYAGVGLCLFVSGYFATRTLFNVVQHRLINPPPRVIIDSSKAVGWFTRLKRWIFGGPKQPTMIFPAKLKERLKNICRATKNIAAKIKAGKTNIKFRNTLLYGPPGTGKTMFALQLAKSSNMEFVMVTGSSFFQTGAGIAAIDELFAWANKSKHGLCIFIDEADSLLSGRDKMDPTSENYRIVNHFLNYLGQRSNKFMIVLATNYPVTFDEAMQRRIDDAIELPLPEEQERFATLCHYRDLILKDIKQNGKLFVLSVQKYMHDEKVQKIAQATNGFSYGDLEGIINLVKSEADIADDAILSEAIVDRVVRYALEKKAAFKKK